MKSFLAERKAKQSRLLGVVAEVPLLIIRELRGVTKDAWSRLLRRKYAWRHCAKAPFTRCPLSRHSKSETTCQWLDALSIPTSSCHGSRSSPFCQTRSPGLRQLPQDVRATLYAPSEALHAIVYLSGLWVSSMILYRKNTRPSNPFT